VTSLTGLGAFDWLLAFVYALGLVLIVQSRLARAEGWRVFGVVVVVAFSGLAVWLVLAVAYPHDTGDVASGVVDRGAAVVVALITLVAAVAGVDFLLGRLRPLAGAVVARLPLTTRRADLALLLGVAVPTALVLAAIPLAKRHLSTGAAPEPPRAASSVTVRAALTLPGHPMDLVFRTPTSGYLSFGEGTIARFELPSAPQGTLRVTTVASGLLYPRGIAVLGDTLFAVELGPLPCKPSFPTCKGYSIPGEPVETVERTILRTARARVLAFHIEPDGRLTSKRTVVADLPFANTDHGVNDVEVGPEGRLFVSIGNLDLLYKTPELAPDLRRPRAGLLGTVISFEPDGSDLEVYAKGLRNVYGLTFDDQGRLYGTDNDGATRGTWRREEVLQIRRGANYGYPWDGTYAPYRVPRAQPLWVLDTVGSGGIAWVPDRDGKATLYVGSGGHLDALTLTEQPDGSVGVADRSDVTRLLDLPGFVTAVKPRPGGLALGVYTFDNQPKLYLLDVRHP
jgi:hypothetical protein